ncbi:MAG: MaoC/PaaZ C-terminal domain-containing protein [Pseudomonadota bacterium]
MSGAVYRFTEETATFSPAALLSGEVSFVGEKIAISPWLEVTQADIDLFGMATKDPDPMHDDPEWARQNSPFGATIAYGFQTLSLLSHLNHLALPWPDTVAYGLNYGLERVRFLHPVIVGASIRAHIHLKGFRSEDDGRRRFETTDVVEIKGVEKPALIADRIGYLVMAQS